MTMGRQQTTWFFYCFSRAVAQCQKGLRAPDVHKVGGAAERLTATNARAVVDTVDVVVLGEASTARYWLRRHQAHHAGAGGLPQARAACWNLGLR